MILQKLFLTYLVVSQIMNHLAFVVALDVVLHGNFKSNLLT